MNISNPLHLLLIIVAALLLVALIICLLVFLVKPSKGRDSFRLAVPFKLAGGKKRKNHVFLGVSPNAQTMASCILGEWKKEKKKKDHGLILFVDMADRFNKTAESELQEELGTSRIKLLGGTRALSHERSLSKAIGLEGLQFWLKSKRTSLYLFSGNPKENARLLSLVSGDNSIRAKVFYYSEEPSGYDDLVASTGSRIRTINPHQMAFMQLKLDRPELMPVNYVKKAVSGNGEPLGYVEEGLRALVLGFGASGQEAVRFLYEYGSFVGKDFLRAPMTIRVMDPALERHLGAFLQSAPALKEDPAIEWRTEMAGSAKFWEEFEKPENAFQYIVVAVDEGPRNIQLAVSLLKAAARCGRELDRMAILLRNGRQNRKIEEIIDTYNSAFCPEGSKVLHSFGNVEDIWTQDVISGKRLKKLAIRFNENQKAMGNEESWEERKERLSKADGSPLRNQQELRRLQAMDISRALYMPTLLTFAPKEQPDSRQMQYLAAQEHLHWMNALFVTGYTDGPKDELLQQHPNLVPYPEIKNDKSRAIGLLAVKSMLEMRDKK